jgi:hypothetical protein
LAAFCPGWSSQPAEGSTSAAATSPALASIEDLVDRALGQLEVGQSTLKAVLEATYPEAPCPSSLGEFRDFFLGEGDRLELFVREQMQAGAENALGLVKAWYPEVDLNRVASGLPDVDVGALVEEAGEPARKVLKLLDEEERP